jgi:hypothetical protein
MYFNHTRVHALVVVVVVVALTHCRGAGDDDEWALSTSIGVAATVGHSA